MPLGDPTECHIVGAHALRSLAKVSAEERRIVELVTAVSDRRRLVSAGGEIEAGETLGFRLHI